VVSSQARYTVTVVRLRWHDIYTRICGREVPIPYCETGTLTQKRRHISIMISSHRASSLSHISDLKSGDAYFESRPEYRFS
jgi:hypothetical protein